MKVNNLTSKAARSRVVTDDQENIVLFSYSTPVAIVSGETVIATNHKYSNTTSRHISNFISKQNKRRLDFNQAQFESTLQIFNFDLERAKQAVLESYL